MRDYTESVERYVNEEKQNKISYLFRLWGFVFSSTKLISIIYLGLFLLLSFFRPFIGILWGKYISVVELAGQSGKDYTKAIIIVLLYSILNWCAELIESFMAVGGDGDLEQLDLVQANRQQELMHVKMFKTIDNIAPEYMEISKFNDRVNQVFKFAGDRDNGLNRKVMLNGYVLIAKVVSVISIATTLFYINRWLTILILIAPLPTIWNSLLKEKLGFKFKRDNTELSRKAEYFQSLLLSPSNKEIKTLGVFDFFFTKWRLSADEYTINERKVIKKQSILGIINSAIMNTLNLSCTIISILFMINGKISLAELGVVLSLTRVLISDTANLFGAFSSFLSKRNEATLFFSFMDMPKQIEDGYVLKEVEKIEMKNLKYRYPLSQNYVLNGINFTFCKGEKIALVGENGAGKSTFVKLILGILKPSEGELKINDHSVLTVQQNSHYSLQSVVMQNPSHYTTFSVYENIYMGKTEQVINKDDIQSAVDFVGLNDVPTDIPLGRDIGGIEMSGGQWQKLAIARAVYRNKDFIILDEPTSNLDPKAETDIFQKYFEISKNKSVIFVTHRVAVASLADRIIVFDKGKIVEEGSHEELMRKKGAYETLFKSQAKWYDR